MTGTVLFLNGASSSGKTSLCRALQAVWPRALVLVGIDTLITMLTGAYTGFGEHAEQGYSFKVVSEPEGRPLTMARTGPIGRALNRRLADFTAGLAADGVDVAVDHVTLEPEDFDDFAERLDPHHSWVIGVVCEPDLLAFREKARGDRVHGLAVEQAARVHGGRWRADLTLDTTTTPLHLLAQVVVDRVAGGTPQALAALASECRGPRAGGALPP